METTTTLQITDAQVAEAIATTANEYIQAGAARAAKRTYDVTRRYGYGNRDRGVVVETPTVRVQVYAYADYNYGRKPRAKVVMHALDDLHYGRQQYLQVPNMEHKFTDGEYMPLIQPTSYRDRKAEKDLGNLMRVYWQVFAATYPDVLHEMAAKAHNEIVQGKIDDLQKEVNALQAQLI